MENLNDATEPNRTGADMALAARVALNKSIDPERADMMRRATSYANGKRVYPEDLVHEAPTSLFVG